MCSIVYIICTVVMSSSRFDVPTYLLYSSECYRSIGRVWQPTGGLYYLEYL